MDGFDVVSGKMDGVGTRDLEPDPLVLTNGDVKGLVVELSRVSVST